MNLKSNRKRDEVAFRKLGTTLSQPYRKRVIEIIKELNSSGGMNITGLLMGMGAWVFEGDDFEATYSDDSSGLMPVRELHEWYSKKVWQPKTWRAKHYRLFQELQEILFYLTDETYMDLLELSKKEIKPPSETPRSAPALPHSPPLAA